MKIGKKIFTVILASAVFAGTVVFESGIAETSLDVAKARMEIMPSEGGIQLTREGKSVSFKNKFEFEVGDVIDTSGTETAVVMFSGNGVLRLASQSRLSVYVADTVKDEFVFKLEKGRAWINTVYTSATVNLLAGGSLLVPRRAALDILYDGVKTVLKVNSGQTGVGLVKPDYAGAEAVRFNADAFINSFLVAQGSQATILQEKVTANADILSKLLYSKLIKEFQYTLYLKSDFTTDPWLSANVKQDRQLSTDVSAAKLKVINARGLQAASLESWGYQMREAATRFADVFTFSRQKVEERLVDSMFALLYDSQYLLTYGRIAEAKTRLEMFGQVVPDEIAKHDEVFREEVMGKLRSAYADLVYVMPDDPLFEAKTRVSDIIFAQLGDSDDDITEKFGLVREYINYAYRLADLNVNLARTMFQTYFSKLAELMTAEKSRLLPLKNLIAEENQIVDNLLKQYPVFYLSDFFRQKYDLENAWLSLLPEGIDKLEEKQSIINTKIDFLKQLQIFFLDEKVVLAEARKIVNSLIVQVEDLKTGAESAINELFNLRLQDNAKFLHFITSAQQGALQGVTMRQKYDSYLAIQKEEITLKQVVDQVKGEQPVETVTIRTAEQILATARGEFTEEGITGLKFGSFSGQEQRLIPVESAILNDIVFSGQYDWDRKLISDVKVSGTVVSQQPVRLENLGLVIKPRTTVTPVRTQETQVTETVSRAERVARLFLIQKMKTNGITLLDADITVLDVEGGQFVIKKAVLVESPDVAVAFSFNGKENVASFVVVSTKAGDKRIDGDVALAEIATKAKALGDANEGV